MWMNLDQLPAGKSMYTLFLSDCEPGPDAYYEEIDVVASSRATREQILEAAKEELEGYVEGMKVVGCSNQSDGYFMWKEEGWV
jgi:predicted RNase H-like HicB family nuclease